MFSFFVFQNSEKCQNYLNLSLGKKKVFFFFKKSSFKLSKMLRYSLFTFCASKTTTTTPNRVSLKKGRPPISDDQIRELFSSEQRARWPTNFRPSVGASAFLRKEGVPLTSLIELRKEITDDHNADLQKDLTYDMNLWTRCCFEQEVLTADEKRKRLIRKVLTRDRIPTYNEVVSFAKVPSLADCNDFEVECRDLPGHSDPSEALESPANNYEVTANAASERLKKAQEARRKTLEREKMIRDKKRYPFTSQAFLQQQKVFSVLEGSVQTLSDRVVFPDFPTFSNLLHHHYDSCSFLKYVAARTGDELLINQEFVRELGLYLRSRMEYYHSKERLDQEAKILGTTTTTTSSSSPTILFLFTNGRLPQALQESAIPIGFPIHATNSRKRLVARKDQALPILGEKETPGSYSKEFPYEIISVTKALEKYKPTIVVAEPHMDRDWTAEMRGFHTVREVILLGQVDSPAMCSFSYPWLSFGCAPSMESYFAYNSLFQKVNVAQDSQFMPMDAPYIQQGYEKLYLDNNISKWMVCSNDTKSAPHQSRCCVFRRLIEKMKKV
jgi:hypothetical protein